MRTIGLFGGTIWRSAKLYYEIINEEWERRYGQESSPQIVLFTGDVRDFHAGYHNNEDFLLQSSSKLEQFGADFIALCTNTMHEHYDLISDKLNIQVLHIVDALGESLNRYGVNKAGILGTTKTMYGDFYTGRLRDKYGIHVLAPSQADGKFLNDAIYSDLDHGRGFTPQVEMAVTRCINSLHEQQVDSMILASSEFFRHKDKLGIDVKTFDTFELHVRAIVDRAKGEEE